MLSAVCVTNNVLYAIRTELLQNEVIFVQE